MKTALVTGASRGIGAACARELARAGWAVAVNYRTSREKAEDVAAQIRQDGGVALAIPGDIGDPEQVEALFRTAETELGSVEVLVNNAGIAQQKLFTDVTEEDWDELFRVDVKGLPAGLAGNAPPPRGEHCQYQLHVGAGGGFL